MNVSHLGHTPQGELAVIVDMLTSGMKGREPGMRMLVHARAGISNMEPPCVRQASLCTCFSRRPGLLGHIELLWLKIPRNCGNSSHINNINKSPQFLRIYYIGIIVLCFDYSIDYS